MTLFHVMNNLKLWIALNKTEHEKLVKTDSGWKRSLELIKHATAHISGGGSNDFLLT